MNQLIGRKEEKAILNLALLSDEAEMISVIGRRRVGKTFLIKETYKKHLVFSITGVQNAPLQEQLQNFSHQLNEFGQAEIPYKIPENWMEAFQMLIAFLKKNTTVDKPVVFFDELPWLASSRSGFLRGLSFFWNSWAVDQKVIVVVCGSAASWMIRKVVNHTGGLHNRITRRIFLEPFNLKETEAYLKSRKLNFDRYQITQLYMALGGIPHYLKEIQHGKSAIQNINEICFSKNGLLRDEFSKLYPALFNNAENHIAVIRALASKKSGLTRNQIIELAKIPSGGTSKRVLEELEQSGFISIYTPFGRKKKDRLYRLTDEYSLFYLHFIDGKIFNERNVWDKLSQTQQYKSWSGYAFESICLKHISQIKKALGISGMYSESASYLKKGTGQTKGVQMDLLIDRNDHIINLFEIKFYNRPYILTKEYAKQLREKIALFQYYTQTKKQIFLSFITTFGILPNEYSLGFIQNDLTLDDLFE